VDISLRASVHYGQYNTCSTHFIKFEIIPSLELPLDIPASCKIPFATPKSKQPSRDRRNRAPVPVWAVPVAIRKIAQCAKDTDVHKTDKASKHSRAENVLAGVAVNRRALLLGGVRGLLAGLGLEERLCGIALCADNREASDSSRCDDPGVAAKTGIGVKCICSAGEKTKVDDTEKTASNRGTEQDVLELFPEVKPLCLCIVECLPGPSFARGGWT